MGRRGLIRPDKRPWRRGYAVTSRKRRFAILQKRLFGRARGYSSAGRAPRSQCGGRGFESPYLHHSRPGCSGLRRAVVTDLLPLHHGRVHLRDRGRHSPALIGLRRGLHRRGPTNYPLGKRAVFRRVGGCAARLYKGLPVGERGVGLPTDQATRGWTARAWAWSGIL